MMIMNNNDKNNENITLSDDNKGSIIEMQISKHSNMIIIVKKDRKC